MVTKELLTYLENSLKGGYQEDDLRKALIGAGWNPQDVAEGFAALKAKTATPAASAVAAPRIATPQSAPQRTAVSAAQPAQNSPTPQILTRLAPTRAAGTPFGAPPRSHRKIITILGVVSVLLLAGGGITYAHFARLITVPFLPRDAYYEPQEVIAGVIGKIKSITSGSYDATISLQSVSREAGAKPFTFGDTFDRTAYTRDAFRLRTADRIIEALRAYQKSKKAYPKSLTEAFVATSAFGTFTEADFKDPQTNAPYIYSPSPDGKSFALTITFETQEALAAFTPAQSMTTPVGPPQKIDGLSVTLDGNYGKYRMPANPELAFPFNVFSLQKEYAAALPENLNASIRISGAFQKPAGDATHLYTNIASTFMSGNMAGNIEFEFAVAPRVNFVRINKFPPIPFDITPLAGKWVRIPHEELGGLSPSLTGGLIDSDALEPLSAVENANASEAWMQFLEAALATNALRASGGEKAVEDGQSVYRYSLSVNREALPAFAARLASLASTQSGGALPPELATPPSDLFTSPEFSAAFSYFEENGTLELLTDTKTGYPASFSYRLRLVPEVNEASLLKDRQFVLSSKIAWKNINANPEFPSTADALTLTDAQALVFGVSTDRFILQQQDANLARIRAALEAHRELAGTYPDTLEALMVTGSEILAKRTTPPKLTPALSLLIERYREKKLLSALPRSEPQGTSFVYAKTKDDYTLTYSIKLPSFKEKEIAFFDAVDVRSGEKKIKEIFVNGMNTASKKLLSQEADAQSKIDTDKDGISDTLEAYFATDPKKKDSDADGKNDYEELVARTNPLGAGPLETNERWRLIR